MGPMSSAPRVPALALALCLLVVAALLPQGEATLVHVHAIYRHGDRSPIHIFPKATHKESAWPMGLGQLTRKGMREHFELGSLMRERYGGRLLNASYWLGEIHVRSTDYERTLMSAATHLSGLYYPAATSERWNATIPWVPVPVHTIPQQQDIMLVDTPCPRYDQLEDELLHSPLVEAIVAANQDLFDLLQRETGMEVVNASTVWQVQDTLFCQEQHNMSMPPWFTATIRRRLYNFADFGWCLKYYNEELRRLRAGVLLQVIVEHMQAVAQGKKVTSGGKMVMYSGHDTDVAALLSALNVFNGQQPPYASMLLVELHREKSVVGVGQQPRWFVRLFFHNSSVDTHYHPKQPLQMTLPNCSSDCPLGDFARLTLPERLTREEYADACRISSSLWSLWSGAGDRGGPLGDTSNVVTLLVGGLCLLGLVLVLAVMLVYLFRQSSHYRRLGGDKVSVNGSGRSLFRPMSGRSDSDE